MKYSFAEQARALSLAVTVHALALLLLAAGLLLSGPGALPSLPARSIEVGLDPSQSDLDAARAAIRAAQLRLRGLPRQKVSPPSPPQPVPPPDFDDGDVQRISELIDAASLPETEPASPAEAAADAAQDASADAASTQEGTGTDPAAPAAAGPESAASGGFDPLLESRYMAALRASVYANWDSARAPAGMRCDLDLVQAEGGHVVDVRFVACDYPRAARDALERSLRGDQLPYIGFEPVFARHRIERLSFCQPRDSCAR